jgi:hypothetical protein
MKWHITRVQVANPSVPQRWIELQLATRWDRNRLTLGFVAERQDALDHVEAWARQQKAERAEMFLLDIYVVLLSWPGLREIESVADARRHPYRELVVDERK